jgi:hypothetical protein
MLNANLFLQKYRTIYIYAPFKKKHAEFGTDHTFLERPLAQFKDGLYITNFLQKTIQPKTTASTTLV